MTENCQPLSDHSASRLLSLVDTYGLSSLASMVVRMETENEALIAAIAELHHDIWNTDAYEHLGDVAKWCREMVGDEAIDGSGASDEGEAS